MNSAFSTTAPAKRPHSTSRETRIAWWIVAAACAINAALLLALAYAGVTMNRAARATEKSTISREVDRAVLTRLGEQKGVALWDEAVVRTAHGDRAWMDQEIAGYLIPGFGHDALYILDSQNRPFYRAVKTTAPDDAAVMRAIAPLVRRARSHRHPRDARDASFRPYDSTAAPADADRVGWAGDIVSIDGRPAIAAMMTIVPTKEMDLFAQRPVMLVSLVWLNATEIARIGSAAAVGELRLVPKRPRKPAIPFVAQDGASLGWLSWTPARPGSALLEIALPLLLLASASTGVAGLALLRRLFRASHKLAAEEAGARALSLQDSVSRLPNRRAFAVALDETLRGWRAGKGPAPAVAYIDLDHFKDVNDTLGHAAGDALVVAIAERLRAALGTEITLARIGGDEFAAIARLEDAAVAGAFGQRICDAIEAPFTIGGDGIAITVSVGIAVASECGDDPDRMTRRADIALYEAKSQGRSRAVVFVPEMEHAVIQRRRIATDLPAAIAGHQLRLVYQPVMRIGGGDGITGAEALLRWTHPELGVLSPDSFIPIAERSQQMHLLGDWVIGCALADMANWPGLEVAINLSPTQLRHPGFAAGLAERALQAGVDPGRVILEVTENVVMDASLRTQNALGALQSAGFRIALDDFGTGYSSLSYLARFRFDRLKIDRTLIRGVGEDEAATAVMETAIALGLRLGLDVVAEGIETEAQATLMRVAGCTHLQGYLISPPLEFAAFDRTLGEAARFAGSQSGPSALKSRRPA
jgi:diguanylate cyclase (GGDEF)-like protein